MLHTLLALTRNLFVFDLETTSADTATARIVEIGFQQFNADGLIKEWQTRVNPGIPIPPESTKIHKIEDADVADRPLFAQIAPNLAKGFSDCDYAGQNLRFDLQVLANEMARVGVPWSYLDARIIDSLRLEHLGEPRSLSNLYTKHTGLQPEGAHEALSDVRMATAVIECQLKKYTAIPRDLGMLHELQWPGFIDGSGKFRMIDGVPHFGSWGKYKNKPMTAADNGYWDFILSADFPEDVKEIARKAKLKQYPQVKV